MNKGYRDLEVYNLAHDLGVKIHEFSLKMPRYELYETGSQLRRSSKSISANIVEGYGRKRYKAEFAKFLVYALASCDETTEWIRYVKDCHPDLSEQAENLLVTIDELGRKLNNFLKAVETNHISGKSQVPRVKRQVSSDKNQATSVKPQVSRNQSQAPSDKRQASSI